MNRIKDYGKLATDITNWIKDYAQSNNIKSLVVGVSGGIDSAVVSTLCAMTRLDTHGMILPIYSKMEHKELALRHVQWVSNLYTNFQWGFTHELENALTAVCSIAKPENPHAVANTKSRLRMVTLYHMAAYINGIVVGTGNKVEDFGVGFYTKYGDGGVDISPIADLYKSEVRELGRYLGISQDIIDAIPTDGLWEDGRCDEDQIGATYEELENIMHKGYYYGEDGVFMRGGKELVGRELEVARIYNKLNIQNRHKMLPIPIYKLIV